MSASLFDALPLAPRDPILGLTEQFVSDPRQNKVNLGVGVYNDDHGKLPLLESVSRAEAQRVAAHPARGYLPIDGIAAFNQAVQALLFGADSALVKDRRVATVQSLGGTGALKIAADLARRFRPDTVALISDPSWENHQALLEGAGFPVRRYRYYDSQSHGLDFDGMLADLRAAPDGALVVLHVCCHNPTGVDLDAAQWEQVAAVVRDKDHLALLDFAYQGFAEGIDADALAVRVFVAAGIDFMVASSFSKSFSLYGERIGALSCVCASADEAARVLSQLKRVVRTNYSNPPTHGGAMVATVLSTPELRQLWEAELGGMRQRIREMREGLVTRLQQRNVPGDFSFVTRQRGMFSYSGLTPAQVEKLREQFGIYAIGTGRICLAALNSTNIDYVADGIASVVGR